MEGKFAGVEVKKNTMEVAVRPTGELWTSTTTEDGMAETADKLRDISPQLVVMEANGNLELPVAGTLAAEGLPFALVHPKTVRDFARSIGRLGRNEKGQADLLAYFAELVKPEVRVLSVELMQQLKELKNRRKDTSNLIALERSRLTAAAGFVQKDLQAHIHFLEKSIVSLDEQLTRLIRSSTIWL